MFVVWCLDWCPKKTIWSRNLVHRFAVIESMEVTLEIGLPVTR